MFSVEHLNALRSAEIDVVATMIAPASRVLEIGAGTGRQARRLAQLGHRVEAIDIPTSVYAETLEFPVLQYDGITIPFEDASFDVVYTSNLLEHVRDLRHLHDEVQRVLVPGGQVIHVVPTHVWRAWTSATAVPDAFVQTWAALTSSPSTWLWRLRSIIGTVLLRRHGERGNIISETWLYHPTWWRHHLELHEYQVIKGQPVGYFYTGNMLFGPRLSLSTRRQLAAVLGSACHVFLLRVGAASGNQQLKTEPFARARIS